MPYSGSRSGHFSVPPPSARRFCSAASHAPAPVQAPVSHRLAKRRRGDDGSSACFALACLQLRHCSRKLARLAAKLTRVGAQPIPPGSALYCSQREAWRELRTTSDPAACGCFQRLSKRTRSPSQALSGAVEPELLFGVAVMVVAVSMTMFPDTPLQSRSAGGSRPTPTRDRRRGYGRCAPGGVRARCRSARFGPGAPGSSRTTVADDPHHRLAAHRIALDPARHIKWLEHRHRHRRGRLGGPESGNRRRIAVSPAARAGSKRLVPGMQGQCHRLGRRPDDGPVGGREREPHPDGPPRRRRRHPGTRR